MFLLLFRDCFVVEMHQLWDHEDCERSHAVLSTLPDVSGDKLLLHRVAHHRQVLEGFKHHRNSEYETSRKFDATVVRIEQLNVVIWWHGLDVKVAISVDDQRFQVFEAAKKLEIFDPIVRQIKVSNVVSENLNDDAWNFLQALKRKRNSPVSYFIEENCVAFAGSVNERRTLCLLANYKHVDLLTRLNVQAAN